MLRSRPTSLKSSFNTGKVRTGTAVRQLRSPGLYCTQLVLIEVESEKCGGHLGLFTGRKIVGKPPAKQVMTFFFFEDHPKKIRSSPVSLPKFHFDTSHQLSLKYGLELSWSVQLLFICYSLILLLPVLKLAVRL